MRTLISIVVSLILLTKFSEIKEIYDKSPIGELVSNIKLSTGNSEISSAGFSYEENLSQIDPSSHKEVLASGELDLKFEKGRLAEILIWSQKNKSLELRGLIDQKTKITIRNRKISSQDIDLLNGKKVMLYGTYISGGRGKEESLTLRNVEIFVSPDSR